MNSLNFQFLEAYDEQLVRYAAEAERYIAKDPEVAVFKIRKFAELLAQLAAEYSSIAIPFKCKQLDLLKSLKEARVLDRETAALFHELRKAGNAISHEHQAVANGEVIEYLKTARKLALWFDAEFGTNDNTPSGTFIDPSTVTQKLRTELKKLRGRGSAQLSDSLYFSLLWFMDSVSS